MNELEKIIINGIEIEYDPREFRPLEMIDDASDEVFEAGNFTKSNYLVYIGNGVNPVHNPKGNTSCAHMFSFYNRDNLNLSEFDTSEVIDMSFMFMDCCVKSLDLSNFDTSNVEDMSGMFAGCKFIEELDLSTFDTSNVENTSTMFSDCCRLKKINLHFDTFKVYNMSGMFNGCSSMEELDLTTFNTANVLYMDHMFSYCSHLKTLIIPFNTDSLRSMWGMFSACGSLEELDLSAFDVSNVVRLSQLFYNCRSLKKLKLFKSADEKIADIDNNDIFGFCTSLKSLHMDL